ncbi:MAG: ComF family protein [Proteobacteria bacterium]|nr:ComF family protein [Pseudomonadota bacterium]
MQERDPARPQDAAQGCWSRLARALWPPRCLLCGEPGAGRLDLCRACAGGLPWNRSACISCAIPLPDPPENGSARRVSQTCGACLRRAPPLTEALAACIYAAPMDRLLPRLKFHRDLATGRLLAQLMAQAFAPTVREWPSAAVLVPVPLHRARLRERGYDQALELARPLARTFGLRLMEGALQRTRGTSPQSRLDAPQRRRNLDRAFAPRAGMACPAHVALVDDVMTTGATLHSATKALRRAGVARVDGWVCARVP